MARREYTLAQIAKLYQQTRGEAWEPPNRNNDSVQNLIERGFIRPCVMRCGFEAFDTGVTWTEAGHYVMKIESTKLKLEETTDA